MKEELNRRLLALEAEGFDISPHRIEAALRSSVQFSTHALESCVVQTLKHPKKGFFVFPANENAGGQDRAPGLVSEPAGTAGKPEPPVSLEKKLADALRMTRSSLENWVELQDAEDARQYDDDALQAADEALQAFDAAYPPSTERLRASEALPAGAAAAGGAADGLWTASDYAVSSGETGACVMQGDDTILDIPYPPTGSWPKEQCDAHVRRIVACVNACRGIPEVALEAGDLMPALAASASVIRDLRAGYPWNELCEGVDVTLARFERLGIVDETPALEDEPEGMRP